MPPNPPVENRHSRRRKQHKDSLEAEWLSGAGGCGKRSVQAEEGLEGLLRTVGKYWEVLRSTAPPSDCHWFEPKHEALSTLSPATSLGSKSSLPPSVAFHQSKKEISEKETAGKTQGGGSWSNDGMQMGLKSSV